MQLPRRLVESVARDGPIERIAWLDRLPDLVTDVAERWDLQIGAPYQPGGATAWVAPARRAAEDVVLKLTWRGAEREESRSEADGLRAWDGVGAVRLLDEHRHGSTSALLLEVCEPGTPLAQLPEAEQDVVISKILQRLWISPPHSAPFRPLAHMCDWWADESAACGIGDAGLVREGLELFRILPHSATRTVLLCTDLHAGNVLAARREPWLAIDPKPYLGDPHYDALQHLLNCERLRHDPLALVRRMADLLDLDADRLRLWLFARCVQESAHDPQLLSVARRVAP